MLAAVWRPALRGYTREEWRVAPFGMTLAAMNLPFYESIARIPLGVAVTFEFVGPLGVAIRARAGRSTWCGWRWRPGASCSSPGRGRRRPGHPRRVLAFMAGACWAAYILLSARTGRRFPVAPAWRWPC